MGIAKLNTLPPTVASSPSATFTNKYFYLITQWNPHTVKTTASGKEFLKRSVGNLGLKSFNFFLQR